MNVVKVVALFLLSLSLIPQVTAKELNRYYQQKVSAIVGELIEATHPSLNLPDLQFSYHELDNPSYFFESNFGLGRAILGKNHYKIGVNPLVFDKEISREALVGVIAHELVHTEDYVSGSTLGTLLPIGIKLLGTESKRQYERKTDLKVILKGLYYELLAYKKWQYPLLSKKDLKKKRLEYLTPEEIKLIVHYKDIYPQMILNWLKNEVPFNIQDLNLDIYYYGNELRDSLFDVSLKRKKDSFSIEIMSNGFQYEKCKLDIYPRGKNGHFFTKKKTYSINSLSSKQGIRKKIKFSKKVHSLDFRLYDCQDMDGDGIFFKVND